MRVSHAFTGVCVLLVSNGTTSISFRPYLMALPFLRLRLQYAAPVVRRIPHDGMTLNYLLP